MKKQLIAILILILSGLTSIAQTQKDTTRLTTGVVLAVFGNTNIFDGNQKMFTPGYNISPNVCLVTSAGTYHNLMFGLMNSTAKMINGRVRNNFGQYVLVTKNFSNKDIGVGAGAELFFPQKSGLVNFVYADVSKNLTNSKSPFVLQVGVHMNYQKLLKKMKR